MNLAPWPWLIAAIAATAGCGSDAPAERAETRKDTETVFEPLVETLDRAAGVQQTIDDQAAELRRRIDAEE